MFFINYVNGILYLYLSSLFSWGESYEDDL